MGSKKNCTDSTPWKKETLRTKYGMEPCFLKDPKFKERLQQCLITTAGVYLDQETVGETEEDNSILKEKSNAIKEKGHCLWAFSYTKLNVKHARAFCEKWAGEEKKPVYLLLRYTKSPGPDRNSGEQREQSKSPDRSSDKQKEPSFTHFSAHSADGENEQVSEDLLFELFGKNDNCEDELYSIPNELQVTAAPHPKKVEDQRRKGKVYARAYCIEKLGYLDECLDTDKLFDMVQRRKADDSISEGKSLKTQSDTSCIQVKKGMNLETAVKDGGENSPFTNCLVAKLMPPYVITVCRKVEKPKPLKT